MLDHIARWVEKGEAPDRVVLTQLSAAGEPTRTRPAFPYPAAPRYAGKGDVNDQASFSPISPKATPDDKVDWNWAPR